jgi:hypothetical protein
MSAGVSTGVGEGVADSEDAHEHEARVPSAEPIATLPDTLSKNVLRLIRRWLAFLMDFLERSLAGMIRLHDPATAIANMGCLGRYSPAPVELVPDS